jgi:hypothetical protein
MVLLVTCAVLAWTMLVVLVVALCKAAAAAGSDEEPLPPRAPRVHRFFRRTAAAGAEALVPPAARDATAPLGPAPRDPSLEK